MSDKIDFIELDTPQQVVAGEPPLLLEQAMHRVGHVQVELVAQVGSTHMTVDELFALRAGDVVRLDEQINEPVVLCLNGKVVARGSLVAVEDNFAILLSEIL